MKFTIDRTEAGVAVLIAYDDETVRISLPLSSLPPGSQEGDVLILSFERDETATQAAKDRVSGLIRRLRKN